jgi:FkbM family methyltransferase
MSFISYAQNAEDVLLWRALRDVAAGCYIDVGANDPELHSVTKAFYDAGWSGINIEPMPSYRAAFAAQRPRDINLNVAAGAAAGEITLYDVPDMNGWASTDSGVAETHRDEGYAVVEHTVPLRTLADICAEHVRGPVHFLKVDVEGFEADVLRGMDFRACRPWIVVVEAMLPNSRESNHGTWEALVTDHGYQFAWFDGLNRYYVADEHAELAPRLAQQPNVFDDYISHHLDKAWARGRALEQQADKAWEAAERQARTAQDNISQLEAALRSAEQRAAELESNLHQSSEWGQSLERQLLAVYASTSWRITAPLRFIARRGEHSMLGIAKRRARGAVRRTYRWLSQRESLRRVLLPILMRNPALDARLRVVLDRLKQAGPMSGPADVPHLLRELPLSARKVLADLRAVQQNTEE